MTTKAQEREALKKIQKIVADLGENSYVGTALDGCFELADQNIEYDAAFSLKGQIDVLNETIAKLTAENNEQARNHENDARRFTEQKQAEIAALKAEIAAIQQPAEVTEELIADLAAFSMVYIDRIRGNLLRGAGQIAKDRTAVKLLHEYSIRKTAEAEDFAKTAKDVIKYGAEFTPSNNCLTHARSYQQVLEDLLHPYFEN